MSTMAHKVRCPECGAMHPSKVIFYRENRLNKARKNATCRKCEKKNKGINGYDIEISSRNELVYVATTCRGMVRNFNQENLRCPICNAFAKKVSEGNYGFNVQCENPDCSAIGFDYKRDNDYFYATASGIANNVSEYSNIKYSGSKLGMEKQIGRYED